MEKNQEELERLLDALRQGKLKGHEISRAVQAFGENNFQVARPEVETLLQSDDFELRFVALKVLTQYWHLAEHWETAYQVLLHDPEVECRFRAARDLGSLKMNTQDARTLNVLAHIVCNEQEELIVREASYGAMLGILRYDPQEQWRIAAHGIDFATGVDWEMVKRYCKINENI